MKNFLKDTIEKNIISIIIISILVIVLCLYNNINNTFIYVCNGGTIGFAIKCFFMLRNKKN